MAARICQATLERRSVDSDGFWSPTKQKAWYKDPTASEYSTVEEETHEQ